LILASGQASATLSLKKLAIPFRAAVHWCAMASQAGRNGKCFRVLGVDPAAAGPTGYGVVESDGRQVRTLHYGALRISSGIRKEGPAAGLRAVHERLASLMEEFSPDAVAIESVFTALNIKTALRLAEVRGVVLLAAAQHGVPVHSYSPREVKSCVAGYGQASKEQMQLMVRAVLGMTETPEPADAADALAVAVCHVQAERVQARFEPLGMRCGETSRAAPAARAPRTVTARISPAR
jgi:crossover junction endodeoxyribonuclease RuvC